MKSISVQQRRDRAEIPLIDVREQHEYHAGHVPGAINLPMSTLGDQLHLLPEGEFDVICEVGGRSARVAQALEARGHEVVNVDGGTRAWIDAGYAVEH
jgi:rhodanese-related sulfurtransferase